MHASQARMLSYQQKKVLIEKNLNTLINASDADIIVENNKKRLREQFIVLSNLVNKLLHKLYRIELNEKSIQSCIEVGYRLQSSVSVTCLEQVTDFSVSNEKNELRLTLKFIYTEVMSACAIIDKVEKEGWVDSHDENSKAILGDTINADLASKIGNHISTANKIIERQNQLLKQANLDLHQAKTTLSNHINHLSNKKDSYFDSIINNYHEQIRALEEQDSIHDREIKQFLSPYKESFIINHACFQRDFEKYQDGLEIKLEEDEKSWTSRFLTWISQYVPCIKNRKRDLLKAEKTSAIKLIENYNAHCDALYKVMDQSKTSIAHCIEESNAMMAAYKNPYFDFSYSQLIQESNIIDNCCKQYQAEKAIRMREVRDIANERNRVLVEKVKSFNRLYVDLKNVDSLLVNLQYSDNVDNIDYKKISLFNRSNSGVAKQGMFSLSSYMGEASALFINSFFNKIKEIISPGTCHCARLTP